MDEAERSQLLQALQDRRETIADGWYQTIAQTSFVSLKTTGVQQRLVELTDQIIALLLADPFETEPAQAIGQALASLHYIQPETLGQTQGVLARQLGEGLSVEQTASLYPRLTALLGELATGFHRQACEIMLTEQESIRAALVGELRAAETALRQAHDELELRVQERTAALQKSEARYRTLLEGVRDGVYTLDTEGRFTFVNDVIVQRSGRLAEWFLGQHFLDITRPEDHERTLRGFEAALQGESVSLYELAYPTASGGLRWVEMNTTTLYENGRVIGVLGVSRDLTKRKQAEEALQRSEERYRIISEIISDVAYAAGVQPDGTLTREWLVGAVQRSTGFTPEEIAARGGWASLIHPDDMPIALQHLGIHLSGQPDVAEYRIITKDGQVRWWRDYGYPVWDEEQGRVVRIYGASQDITERKQAEEALQESEETARALLNTPTDDVAVLIDTKGVILDINEAMARRFNRRTDELIGISSGWDLIPPDLAERRKAHVNQVIRSGKPCRFEDNRLGTWFDNVFYPILDAQGQVTKIAILARDITDRKRAEENIKQHNRELAALNAIAEAVNSTLNLDEVLNRALEHTLAATSFDAGLIALADEAQKLQIVANLRMPPSLLGFQTFMGAHVATWIARDDPILIQDGDPDVWPPGHPPIHNTGLHCFCIVPLSSREKPLGILILATQQDQGPSPEDVGLAHAVAQQAGTAIANARLYQQAAQERQKVTTILRSVGDGVCTTDRARIVVSLNPAAERLLGWQEHKAIGHPCREVLRCHDTQTQPSCDTICPLVVAMQEQRYEYSRLGMLFLHTQYGQHIPVWSVAGPLVDAEGTVLGGVMAFRDATHEAEMERLQNEFTSMVSHEVRAPLTNLKAAAQTFARLEIRQDDKTRVTLARIIAEQCDRLDRLVQKVETVARFETGRLDVRIAPLHLFPLVRDVAYLFQVRESHRAFQVRATDEADLWVLGDEDKIVMVLNNLLDNAAKYSHRQGTIIVEVQPWETDQVLVAVVDEGPGIPVEQWERIFRRFYRVDNSDTQTVYGLGLGLYIVRELVAAQNGKVWLEAAGPGNRFCFTLPRSHPPDGEA